MWKKRVFQFQHDFAHHGFEQHLFNGSNHAQIASMNGVPIIRFQKQYLFISWWDLSSLRIENPHTVYSVMK